MIVGALKNIVQRPPIGDAWELAFFSPEQKYSKQTKSRYYDSQFKNQCQAGTKAD
jgi:hypothetical protein